MASSSSELCSVCWNSTRFGSEVGLGEALNSSSTKMAMLGSSLAAAAADAERAGERLGEQADDVDVEGQRQVVACVELLFVDQRAGVVLFEDDGAGAEPHGVGDPQAGAEHQRLVAEE